MSWKDRAIPVSSGTTVASGWRSRAVPVSDSPASGPLRASTADTVGTMVAKGATLGSRPFLAGIGEGAGEAAGTFQGLSHMDFFDRLSEAMKAGKDGFSRGRKQARDEQDKVAAANPKLALASEIAGGVLTAPVTGVASGVSGLLKAGATAGGAQALGEAESLKDAAKMVGTGAGFSLAGGAVGKAASKLTGKASSSLKGKAERSAFNALRGSLKDARKALNRDQVQDIGREVLDSGIIGKIPRSIETLADRAGKAKNQTGEQIEAFVNSLDESLGEKVSRGKIADDIASDLQISSGIPGAESRNARIKALTDEFRVGGQGELGIKEAQALKQEIKKQAKFDKFLDPNALVPDDVEVSRALYQKMNETLDDKTAALARANQGEVGEETFKNLRKTYGNRAEAEKIASDRVARDMANRLISPSDYGAGIAGALYGGAQGDNPEERFRNMLLGLSAGAVNRGARKYGSQVAAKSLDALGDVIPGSVDALIQSTARAKSRDGSQSARIEALRRLLGE